MLVRRFIVEGKCESGYVAWVSFVTDAAAYEDEKCRAGVTDAAQDHFRRKNPGVPIERSFWTEWETIFTE